jgi:hypothetical protein
VEFAHFMKKNVNFTFRQPFSFCYSGFLIHHFTLIRKHSALTLQNCSLAKPCGYFFTEDYFLWIIIYYSRFFRLILFQIAIILMFFAFILFRSVIYNFKIFLNILFKLSVIAIFFLLVILYL